MNNKKDSKKPTFLAYGSLIMYLGVQKNRGDINFGEGCEIVSLLCLHHYHLSPELSSPCKLKLCSHSVSTPYPTARSWQPALYSLSPATLGLSCICDESHSICLFLALFFHLACFSYSFIL
ncbi:hypothetical protein HJG60_010622 [Phyllostomus discolor]|uniref:Uncharacterized protein n=1 Tax=Phyllostomus discolor TaxID=89673 RepID=A0A834EHM8_9CHIR|nr:hypothetical protein HJG60_010622 [Phyllostomus discolor]